MRYHLLRELSIVLFLFALVAILLSLFDANNPLPTPALPTTPRPTPTPYPLDTILATRAQLLHHLEYRYDLDTWTAEPYPDGAIQTVGQNSDGRLDLRLWTTIGNPDDLSQVYFTFRFNEQKYGGGRDWRNGTGIMRDTIRLAFPQWAEGERWIKANMREERAKTVIDGVSVYLQRGYEMLSGDNIIVFVIIEE